MDSYQPPPAAAASAGTEPPSKRARFVESQQIFLSSGSNNNNSSITYENVTDGAAEGEEAVPVIRMPEESELSQQAEQQQQEQQQSLPYMSSTIKRMFSNMNYIEGKGLGKNQEGRLEPVQAYEKKGRTGLGFQVASRDPKFTWSEGDDEVVIERSIDWLSSANTCLIDQLHPTDWMQLGPGKNILDDEVEFIDAEVLAGVLECKNYLDTITDREIFDARRRSNPYETVKNAIFMNRAAVKIAEIDATLQLQLSKPFDGTRIFYFADICAGPGGFTEYLLWRNSSPISCKGFGLTLSESNDFKLEDMLAGPSECFYPYYGPDGTGDIYLRNNMIGFQKLIHQHTEDQGVHLVTGDGGFSVKGEENIQEIRSKQLYLCQALTGLLILRNNGAFVCKLFDLFTPFSIGLMYLLWLCFDQFALFKPATSRPANSERYVVCRGFRQALSKPIVQYLLSVNDRINELKVRDRETEVMELVPLSVLKGNKEFYNYILESNNSIGRQQIIGLSKLSQFNENRSLIDLRQSQVREDCLKHWQIPMEDRCRTNYREEPTVRIKSLLASVTDVKDLLPKFITDPNHQLTANKLMEDRDFFPYENKVLVCGSIDIKLVFSRGNNSMLVYDQRSNRWHQPEMKSTIPRLPKDTLALLQLNVNEYQAPKFQMKRHTVHLIDAPLIFGQSLIDKPFRARLQHLEQLCQCINFHSVQERIPLRPPRVFRAYELMHSAPSSLQSSMQTQVLKGSRRPKSVLVDKEDGSLFEPVGLIMFRTTKDPWKQSMSRSTGRLYYFNKENTRQTTFDLSPEFEADYKLHVASMHWIRWQSTAAAAAAAVSAGPNAAASAAVNDASDLDLESLQRVVSAKLLHKT